MDIVLGLALLVPLSMSYIIYLLAAKETGSYKVIGLIMAWAMIILVIFMVTQIVSSTVRRQRGNYLGAMGMGPGMMCPDCLSQCALMMRRGPKPVRMMDRMPRAEKRVVPMATAR